MIGYCQAVLAASNALLIISDIHLDLTKQDTMEISPSGFNHNNDLDLNSFFVITNRLKKAIESGEYKKPKAIIVLGDNIHHGIFLDFFLSIVINLVLMFLC